MLYKYRSGFCAHLSTDTCLSYLSDRNQGFESGMFTAMILIDLHDKAFNTIEHDIFLDKMVLYV